jgi:protein-L-isoaspartate(D-aspartate) O-methyltransferase
MTTTDRNRSRQEEMIQRQLIGRDIRDARVIAAVRDVPREAFFPADSDADPFADGPAAIGHGQTISQPYIVALMTEALRLAPTSRVLEIGTGSGYQTAILAKLAAEVWSVERIKPLLDNAFEVLHQLGIRNVHYRFGDGTLGWPEAAPFDRILIAAGAPELPRQLLMSHLAEGGMAVLPVGPQDDQMLVRCTRKSDALQVDDLCACRFVPLIGREGWGE